MHGIHIANDIIAKAREQGKVTKAWIEIGEIANITIPELSKQMKGITGFDFEISEKKARVRCKCGYEGSPKILERQHDLVMIECPECSKTPEIVEGDKIILTEVEVED
jgi:Zn finger protein HypA/HybF involved in hydrogenase expression